MSDASASTSAINASAIALGANVAQSLYGVTGRSIKIGIISDSYNVTGTAGANVQAGYLPTNVTVLNDSSTGIDEGQAMIQLAYQIAPSATYYFAAPIGAGIQGIANAVTALQNAGCTVIIDDLGNAAQESLYQTGSVLDDAIENAVAAGVNYFSAAGNDGNNYVQMGFTPITVTIPGIGNVVANNFGNDSPYLPVTIPTNGGSGNLFLQWAQPFASYGTGSPGAANSLAVYLLNAQGQVVASSTTNELGSDPVQLLSYKNNTDSTSFSLVVVQNGGTVPADEIFTLDNNNSGVSFDSSLAGGGTGNIFGHELLSNTNVVNAATYTTSPYLGGTPTIANYSSFGPGVIYYNAQGQALPTPITPNVPTFTSAAGSYTSVPGFGQFDGTSAAAPNAGAVAALMLQANITLSTTEVSALLAQSAIPVLARTGSASASNAGAGLIQARAAVELANAAGGTLWSNAAGGDWNTASNWSSGLLPTSGGAVMLSNDLGAITASYTISVDTAGDSAGSLTLSAPTGMTVGLSILQGGTLSIGGPTTNNITAGDFLVAAGGQLVVNQGSLSVSGSLNSNDGSIAIEQGTAIASNFAQNAGTLTVGGDTASGALLLGGSSGISETGGAITVQAKGTVTAPLLAASASSIAVAFGGDLAVTGNATLQSTDLTDSGQLQANGLFSMAVGSTATIAQGATLTVGGLSVGDGRATSATTTSTITDSGTLVDTGNLAGGTTGIIPSNGTISIDSTGSFLVGGYSTQANIQFTGNGLLDYATDDSEILESGLAATIYGFGLDSGVVEFGSLTYNPLLNYSYSYNLSNGQLDVVANTGTLAAIQLNSKALYDSFDIQGAANNALEVLAVACFAAGTRLMTQHGPIAVEALNVGDAVMTSEGAGADIIWIGCRTVDCQAHPTPEAVWPVCISADAFGPGKPSRDLYLSPDHAIYAEGVLIPVKYLIDGKLIRQVKRSSVTYFHVELARHDILLAEDLPAESYLDTGDRASFTGLAITALHPAWGSGRTDSTFFMEAGGYAPLRVTGPEVARVRGALREAAEAQAIRVAC